MSPVDVSEQRQMSRRSVSSVALQLIGADKILPLRYVQ